MLREQLRPAVVNPALLRPALVNPALLRPGNPLGLALLDDGALKLGDTAHKP